MGLNERASGTYIAMSDGALRMKADQNESGARKRTVTVDNQEKTLWERVFNDIDGYIRNIKTHKGKFGRQWLLTVEDGAETFIITIADDSRYLRSLLEKLPNVDYEKPINIRPYSFEDGKRKMIGVSLKQDDKKILSYFRGYEDNKFTGWLNGIPEPPEWIEGEYDEKKFKRYLMDVMEFLEDSVKTLVLPKIAQADPISNIEVKPESQNTEDIEDDSDLPF